MLQEQPHSDDLIGPVQPGWEHVPLPVQRVRDNLSLRRACGRASLSHPALRRPTPSSQDGIGSPGHAAARRGSFQFGRT